MIKFKIAETLKDVLLIQELAEAIWWPTYRPYIPEQQIIDMLADRYTPDVLLADVVAGNFYVLAYRKELPVGFVHFVPSKTETDVIRIEKLYVLPSEQGLGTGKALLAYVEEQAKKAGKKRLQLNVNRYNAAKNFYDRQGFEVVESVDIPYRSYLLNDYIMEKKVKD